MEDDFPGGCDDDGDVLVMVKKESDNEMDDEEIILFVSPKRKNDLDNRETILYASPRRKREDEMMERYKNSLSRKLHQRLNNRQKLSIEIL